MADDDDLSKSPGFQLPDTPPLPDTSDLDRRLKEVGSSANQVKSQRQETAAQVAKQHETQRKDAIGMGRGLQIGYTIIGFPTLGFVVGIALDNVLHVSYWRGFAGLTGCVIAVVAALILIKQANLDE